MKPEICIDIWCDVGRQTAMPPKNTLFPIGSLFVISAFILSNSINAAEVQVVAQGSIWTLDKDGNTIPELEGKLGTVAVDFDCNPTGFGWGGPGDTFLSVGFEAKSLELSIPGYLWRTGPGASINLSGIQDEFSTPQLTIGAEGSIPSWSSFPSLSIPDPVSGSVDAFLEKLAPPVAGSGSELFASGVYNTLVAFDVDNPADTRFLMSYFYDDGAASIGFDLATITITPIPEPSVMLPLSSHILYLVLGRRRTGCF